MGRPLAANTRISFSLRNQPAPALTPLETLAWTVERVTFHNADTGFAVIRVKARGRRDLVTVVSKSRTTKRPMGMLFNCFNPSSFRAMRGASSMPTASSHDFHTSIAFCSPASAWSVGELGTISRHPMALHSN